MDNDIDRLHLLMKQLFAAFPGNGASAETIACYCADLSEIKLDDLDAACKKLRRSCTFLPSIAEIFTEAKNIEASRKLALRPKESPLEDMRNWKREPIPQEIKDQLPALKELLKSKSMR